MGRKRFEPGYPWFEPELKVSQWEKVLSELPNVRRRENSANPGENSELMNTTENFIAGNTMVVNERRTRWHET
jgi:hypothetical protein